MAIHMNNKIDVGEYVRTDKGEIAKVTSVAKESYMANCYKVWGE